MKQREQPKQSKPQFINTEGGKTKSNAIEIPSISLPRGGVAIKMCCTIPVSNEIFQQVYDSPQSLPGKYKWLTADTDVRKIEKLRSFKCHNWAYAKPALMKVIEKMRKK